MTLNEAYQEKGLAVDQIERWQARLRLANEAIQKHLFEQSNKNESGSDS